LPGHVLCLMGPQIDCSGTDIYGKTQGVARG
jgi:hypothetical protein